MRTQELGGQASLISKHDGDFSVAASDIGIGRSRGWPNEVTHEGLLFVFDKDLIMGSGLNREFAGKVYKTMQSGITFTIFND